MKNIFILIATIIILGCCNTELHHSNSKKNFPAIFDITYNPNCEKPFIPKEWLIKKVPLQEMCDNYKKDVSWQRLKPLLFEGDEIWYFDSPREYWNKLAGRRGYAIIRDGKIVGGFFTALN